MDENVIRNEIEQGIAQVDPNLSISGFSCVHDEEKRKLTVSFTAQSGDDETMEVSVVW